MRNPKLAHILVFFIAVFMSQSQGNWSIEFVFEHSCILVKGINDHNLINYLKTCVHYTRYQSKY